MRKILVSKSWGVYLGNMLGLGFWSKLESLDLPEAVTFENDEAIRKEMADWECLGNLPSDMSYLTVEADSNGFASMENCVKAGAEAWLPNLQSNSLVAEAPSLA